MSVFIASLGFALVSSAVLAVAGVGFTLQFGVTDVMNLAYGSVLILGAYVTYVLSQHGVNVWLGLVAAGAMGALISAAINSYILTPFLKRKTSHIGMVIVTLAVGLVIANVLLAFAGPNGVALNADQGATLRWGDIDLTVLQVEIIALSIVLMIGIALMLTYTQLGKAMRATAANPTLARNCGVRTSRVITLTWLISGGLCGIAGAVFGMNVGAFTPASAGTFLVVVLAASIVGGVGRPYGAMAGALLIGFSTEITAAVLAPEYKYVVAFALLFIAMASRPQGLFVRSSV